MLWSSARTQPRRTHSSEPRLSDRDPREDVPVNHVTWGLDVSTNKKKTAAVAIDWSVPGEARVVDVRHPLEAIAIAPLIAEHRESTWAVDVPFGWPDLFVALMAKRHDQPLPDDDLPRPGDWSVWRTKQVAQRRTDRFLTEHPAIRTRPLPASFQMLGATAAMWVLVEAELLRLGVAVDRSGSDGTVCETYPAAALSAWEFGKSKLAWPALQSNFPFLTADQDLVPRFFKSDDVCDAVVCALVARARDLDLTIPPPGEDAAAARREGWIHVTCEPSERLANHEP
nr:DUF429 domain-containing protein [Aeromicrobium duanguangcaii]